MPRKNDRWKGVKGENIGGYVHPDRKAFLKSVENQSRVLDEALLLYEKWANNPNTVVEQYDPLLGELVYTMSQAALNLFDGFKLWRSEINELHEMAIGYAESLSLLLTITPLEASKKYELNIMAEEDIQSMNDIHEYINGYFLNEDDTIARIRKMQELILIFTSSEFKEQIELSKVSHDSGESSSS